MNRTHILFVLLAFGATLCNAQTNQLPSSVLKGRLTTTDGKQIEFVNLNTGTEQHEFKRASSSKQQALPAARVLRIEKQVGTEAGTWALYLGGAGLLGSILGVLSAPTDIYGSPTDSSADVPIVLGLTAASALIGVAIGSGKKKYATVYDNPAYDSKAPGTTLLRLKLTSPAPRSIGVGLSLTLDYTRR
ncbi:MAG: hypothetical protein ACKVU2_10410 [Saprospiraceae bacterium]